MTPAHFYDEFPSRVNANPFPTFWSSSWKNTPQLQNRLLAHDRNICALCPMLRNFLLFCLTWTGKDLLKSSQLVKSQPLGFWIVLFFFSKLKDWTLFWSILSVTISWPSPIGLVYLLIFKYGGWGIKYLAAFDEQVYQANKLTVSFFPPHFRNHWQDVFEAACDFARECGGLLWEDSKKMRLVVNPEAHLQMREHLRRQK